MNTTILTSIRILPETRMKLRLLKIATNLPTYRLLELMVDAMWAKKETEVSALISQNRANKESAKILKRIRVK